MKYGPNTALNWPKVLLPLLLLMVTLTGCASSLPAGQVPLPQLPLPPAESMKPARTERFSTRVSRNINVWEKTLTELLTK